MTMLQRNDRVTDGRIEPAGRTLPAEWGMGLSLAWLVLVLVAMAVQPEFPPAATFDPVQEVVMPVLFNGGLLATLVGLALRRRWALHASLGTAMVMVAGVVLCGIAGHDPTAPWLLVQGGASLTLVGLTVGALRRT